MEYCKLCGLEIIDGIEPCNHTFKKMCLNCAYCNENNCCTNTVNMEAIKNKINTPIIIFFFFTIIPTLLSITIIPLI